MEVNVKKRCPHHFFPAVSMSFQRASPKIQFGLVPPACALTCGFFLYLTSFILSTAQNPSSVQGVFVNTIVYIVWYGTNFNFFLFKRKLGLATKHYLLSIRYIRD
eukprot:scaffold10056_cov164-Amphora_coffeaeformis.AAC.17